MAQLIPKDDTFAAPDWANSTVGSAQSSCHPYHFFYNAWDPSNSLLASASEYADCPFRSGGPLECSPFGVLYTPNPGSIADAMPVHMTDIILEAQDKMRAFVCREEDSLNHDGLSVEALWGLAGVGASTSGAENQGSGGTGAQRNAARKFPTTDDSGSTSIDNLGLGFNPEGNTDGYVNITPQRTPGPDGWRGCGVAIRVGGGRPGLRASDVSPDYDSEWSFRRIDGYILCAYPQAGATGVLVVDLWRLNCNASNQMTPTRLVRQTITNGVGNWKKDRPYYLRVEAVNNSGDVDLKGYLGDYEQGGTVAERQLFRSGIFTTTAITAGPSGDGSVATTTGIVTDSGANKITAYTDKTFGVIMGRDRAVETSGLIGGNTQVQNTIEGLYRLTCKRTTGGVEVFNDLFERVPFADPQLPLIDEVVSGLFSIGVRQMGVWTHDSQAGNLGSATSTSYRGRLLGWTSGVTNTTAPNDYITALWNNNPPAGGNLPGTVRRIFLHKRPTDNRYNHYRQVRFKGAEDLAPASGSVGTIYYTLFVRGQATQYQHDGIALVVDVTTDGSNNQTVTNIAIRRVFGNLSSAQVLGGEIARAVIQASGAAVPAGWAIPGVENDMALKVERVDEGSDPNAPALLTAYWNSTAITFDTFGYGATQDATSKVVTLPAPWVEWSEGRVEGFGWYHAFTTVYNGGAWWRSYPEFRNWEDLGPTPDPGTAGGGVGVTIAVQGEGTPSAYLKSVVDIDWSVEVEFLQPRYTATFDSGHRYTSPQFGKKRRVILARAENIDKTTYDALAAFYNARSGIEEPFYFNYPIPSSLGSNTLEEIVVCFTSTGLQVRRKAEGVYSVELEMVEVFV